MTPGGTPSSRHKRPFTSRPCPGAGRVSGAPQGNPLGSMTMESRTWRGSWVRMGPAKSVAVTGTASMMPTGVQEAPVIQDTYRVHACL